MVYKIYLSLGSNLGNPTLNLEQAIDILNERAGKVISRSSFYHTEPWGFESENEFVNGCIALITTFTPLEMLKLTQEIEREIGRTAKSNGSYADRIIDIDLLLIDQIDADETDLNTPDVPLTGPGKPVVMNVENLVIPHPLMHKRTFVMDPLSEIEPEKIHPVLLKSLEEITKLIER